jgi:hypothetical protein
MGRNYQKKRIYGGPPTAQAREAQVKQHRAHEEARLAAEAFELQDLPDVKIRDGDAFCPYGLCGYRQLSLAVGVQTCPGRACEKKFRVPDNAVTQAVIARLFRGLSRRQEREEAERAERRPFFGF